MKFTYELSNTDKTIIRVLDNINSIKLGQLFDIIQKVEIYEHEGVDGIIKLFSEADKEKKKENYLLLPYDSLRDSQLKKLYDQIIVLERFELIVTTEQERPIYMHIYEQHKPDIEELKLELAEYGKKVTPRIVQNRRIIVRPPSTLKQQAFIACAFGISEIDTLCEKVFEPILAELKYEPFRVDSSEPEQTITDSIFENITLSSFLIADLTFTRPSVYFEIGIAFGLGLPIILTCRKDHHNGIKDDLKVHFDLEQFKISFWEHENNQFQ